MENIYKALSVENILLVEDDPWTRDSLSLFFGIEGCRLSSAGSAAEAATAMSSERFDMIICEYWLPDTDGLSLLNQLGNGAHGPIKILVSSYPAHPTADEARRLGIHDVIGKPFSGKTLERSLRRLLVRAGGWRPDLPAGAGKDHRPI